MAKKQNVKKEEVKPIVTPKKRATPVKKTVIASTPVVVKKIATPVPLPKKVVKPKVLKEVPQVPEPVVVPKKPVYKVKDLLTEIRAWELTVANLEFKNTTLSEKNKELDTQLWDNLDALSKCNDKLNILTCYKEEIEDQINDIENQLVTRYTDIENLTYTCNNVIPFLKHYKQAMSTNYGPTTVNIIFSLIMFVVFGVSVLAGFGIKHLVNDGTNVSVIAITTLTSVAIGYFLYLVNWKK
jgi:hypothetical protein